MGTFKLAGQQDDRDPKHRSFGFGLDEVRAALEGEHGKARVRSGPDGLTAPCVHPDHADENPSMSVAEKDGRLLVKCHAGCDQDELWSALLDFMSSHGFSAASSPAVAPSDGSDPRQECTLAAYAEAKALPVDFLEELGVREVAFRKRRRLEIPYSDSNIRYRETLAGGSRFKWKSGSKAMLYGLFRLDEMSQDDAVVLVEGESDAQTLWHHGYAALGLPGAATWSDARCASAVEAFATVYVVIEPDTGGAGLMRALLRSDIRDRVRFVTLKTAKDISELHVHDSDAFVNAFRADLDASVSAREIEDRERTEAANTAWAQCKDLAREPQILDVLREDLERSGLVGDLDNALILYLALTTRLLGRPTSVLVKGVSSGGKSFTVERVLAFIPDEAAYTLSAMSERALIYWDEDLRHRFLVLYEASALGNQFFDYLLRSLLSEGHLRYQTVVSTDSGPEPRTIQRDGPTGLILTTTQVSIDPENETRMLSLTVPDSPEHTRSVLRAIARDSADEFDFTRWLALQRWLDAVDFDGVAVPFAERLAEEIPPVATRLRRDFTALLNLVRAHALLHRASRDIDDRGRIVATIEDYAVVRQLLADVLAQNLGTGVSEETREVVEAVRGLTTVEGDTREAIEARKGVSGADIGAELGLDASAAWRRINVAIKDGYLENCQSIKYAKGRIKLGSVELPEDDLLPMPDDIA